MASQFFLENDIFDMSFDKRVAEFEEIYLAKFGHFAHPQREAARKKAVELLNKNKEALEAIGHEIVKNCEEGLKKMGPVAAAEFIKKQAQSLVARQVLNATVRGGADQFGRRMAVVVADESIRLAAAQFGARGAEAGVQAAVEGAAPQFLANAGKMAMLVPGLSAAVGQAVAEHVTGQMGIENHHAKNSIAVGGAVAGGAAAGAVIGGPPGAAVGAVVGVAGWGIGKVIDASIASGLGIVGGPDDNWAYLKIGQIDREVCFSTYNKRDTVYFKSYWNEYRRNDHKEFNISAGQGQRDDFQLTVYKGNTSIAHFQKVYYRDMIFVAKNKKGKLAVAHGKGELWEGEASNVIIKTDD
ncbi:uncharacterized protein LOC129266766 [Lytechinus pictus]|uniref:uncharacterized protein LOC129266766 n=1 Tax=Lytechinus pictus TaxID=7653 RepID=UPI00240D1D31|nr:uncharacterized protein LOC129266766 [Lytechinus pictus]